MASSVARKFWNEALDLSTPIADERRARRTASRGKQRRTRVRRTSRLRIARG